MIVDVAGLDREVWVAALWNVASPRDVWFPTFKTEEVTAEEVRVWLQAPEHCLYGYLGVVEGRSLHFRTNSQDIESLDYDVRNSRDMMQRVIDHVRSTGSCKDFELYRMHCQALRRNVKRAMKYIEVHNRGENDTYLSATSLACSEPGTPNPTVREVLQSCAALYPPPWGADEVREWKLSLPTLSFEELMRFLTWVTSDEPLTY